MYVGKNTTTRDAQRLPCQDNMPYSLRNTLNHIMILAFGVILFMQIELHYVSKLVYILVVLYVCVSFLLCFLTLRELDFYIINKVEVVK